MGRRKRRSSGSRYDVAYKVKVIKEAQEKNLSGGEVEKVYGLPIHTFYTWRRRYLKGGEAALQTKRDAQDRNADGQSPPSPGKWRDQILTAKKEDPCFGVGRILHWLRRTLFLPITYREVRTTLKEENLLQRRPRKRKRNKHKPQSFERAKPNQLWQSDITAFNILGGEGRGFRVYLIAFMDDHSRYIVGWGMYAGQSGALVLEVLRRAVGVFGRPQAILTDNGRQYKSWHGKTDFQRELAREGIEHMTSRPHHPETLGKIESFWSQMKHEWLARIVMGDLETMRERLGHWINHYNFQRPHTRIGNVAPAERFFQYGDVMRTEIEKRIAANEREMSMAAPDPGAALGRVKLGESALEVRKEGAEFVVRLDGREVNRTDLKPKETSHEEEEAAAGTDGSDGCTGKGQSGDGAGGAVGGENHNAGVSGDRTETLAVLQGGGEDGEGHAGNGADARAAGSEPGGGGDAFVGGNSGPAAGAPADAKSAEGIAQADGAGTGQDPQIHTKESGGNAAALTGAAGGGAAAPRASAATGGNSHPEGGMIHGSET
jgi:transposase InsO family protein